MNENDSSSIIEIPKPPEEKNKSKQNQGPRYRLELNHQEWEVIIALADKNGSAAMEELVDQTNLSRQELISALASLEEKGLLIPDTPEEPQAEQDVTDFLQAIQPLNYYQVLGLGFKSSRNDIRKAYYSLIKIFHPNRYIHKSNQKTIEAAKEIFITLTGQPAKGN